MLCGNGSGRGRTQIRQAPAIIEYRHQLSRLLPKDEKQTVAAAQASCRIVPESGGDLDHLMTVRSDDAMSPPESRRAQCPATVGAAGSLRTGADRVTLSPSMNVGCVEASAGGSIRAGPAASTEWATPMTKLALSEARKTTGSAIPFGSASRLRGVRAPSAASPEPLTS